VYQKTGYLSVPVAGLSNLVVLMKTGGITAVDARIYLAGLELVERRRVANRLKALRGEKSEQRACFRVQELLAVTRETGVTKLKRALRKLERLGLLAFDASCIEATRSSLFPDDPLCRELKKRGALSRLVPIPRRLLAELCRETKKSVLLAKLAYIMRGLTLDRQSGELRSRGCIKASWIAQYFGLSMRSVRLARSWLIRSGFIAKDCSSFQRKLNRDGSYFEINLGRYSRTTTECAGTVQAEMDNEPVKLASVPAHKRTDSAGTLTAPVPAPSGSETAATGPVKGEASFAPPGSKKCARIAPPKERQETPYGINNQKTRFAEKCQASASASGVLRTKSGEVSLRNIQFEDLRRISTLKTLFHQAVAANWVTNAESDFQNFVAAAVRATRLRGDSIRTNPVRVFVAIVRKRLWHHITQEQEERAREVIKMSCYRFFRGRARVLPQGGEKLPEPVSSLLARTSVSAAFRDGLGSETMHPTSGPYQAFVRDVVCQPFVRGHVD
jgi:hypothetical protein